MIGVLDRTFYEVVLPDEPFKIHFDSEVNMCENIHFNTDIQARVVDRFCSIARKELQVLGNENNLVKPLIISEFVNSFSFLWLEATSDKK